MEVLDSLEPRLPFSFFEELTHIPRTSYHEQAVSDWLVAFGRERNLEVHQDEALNVILIREASPGRETEEPLILQAHMDMVGEQEPTSSKDMEAEGVDVLIDGDWISADGTTLGADDGAGVAMALALLDDEQLSHPRLEFVCTVSEEVGMLGASALDVSFLKGHRLINIDNEEEGVVLAACAGGADMNISLPVQRDESQTALELNGARISISGLAGGHSGMEIDKGHPNATRLLARVLCAALDAKLDLRLVDFVGGKKSNAIPALASALVALKDYEALAAFMASFEQTLVAEYAAVDPHLRLECTPLTKPVDATASKAPLTAASTRAALTLLACLPDGVQRMSHDIEGMVETSLNLGITHLDATQLLLCTALRSSVDSALAALAERVCWIAQGMGAQCKLSGQYPAWQWVEHSPLRDAFVAAYRELYGKMPTITSLHAGVECGLLAGKIPHLDAISIGPTMTGVHTPAERLSISSFQRTYELLKRVVCA